MKAPVRVWMHVPSMETRTQGCGHVCMHHMRMYMRLFMRLFMRIFMLHMRMYMRICMRIALCSRVYPSMCVCVYLAVAREAHN